MTDWGREIIVDGKRPSWLTGVQTCDLRTSIGWVASDTASQSKIPAEGWNWQHNTGEACIIAIRLPADSYVYRALDAGFEPWPGGDNAPDDWDGGDVLYRTGQTSRLPLVFAWDHASLPSDIIGYHRKSEPTLRTSDEALRRMEALVRRMATRAYDSGWGEEAREILKLLPELPVDPDLLEARRIAQDDSPSFEQNDYYTSGQGDHTNLIAALTRAVRRGRELAAER